MIPLEHILYFASAFFIIGIMGLFLQPSLFRILLSIEAMLNGIAFGFVGTAIHYGSVEGHIMFLIILAVAAAEVGVFLSILLSYDRLFHSLDSGIFCEIKE